MLQKLIGRLGCAAALLAVVASTAFAQTSDKRTYFTFKGPTAVPGVTLPAGRYLIRITNDTTSRNVIQVLSGDGKTPYAMFHTVSAERRDPAQAPELRFMETAVGMPNTVKTFWYAHERGGYEFVYPKNQARLLAKGTGQPVLTAEPELARITPKGEEVGVQAEPFKPEAPALVGEVAPPTLAIAEPRQQARAEVPQARAELPKTASNLPLFATMGVALLLGAALLKGVRLVRE
jgi:LPXTG-motif cell wall-anchored protein